MPKYVPSVGVTRDNPPSFTLSRNVSSPSDRESRPTVVQDLAAGLRRAALEVASNGQPRVGVQYLRQALPLLPEQAAREALADLAGLEALYDMQGAVEHFNALLATAGGTEIVAEAASALLALNPSVSGERTWRIASDAITACEDPDLRLRLLARIGVSALLAMDAGRWRDEVVGQLRCERVTTVGERVALAVTVFADLWCGRQLSEVRRSAETVFRGDWVASLRGNDAAYGLALTALAATDSPLVSQTIDEALGYARMHGATGYEGGILAVRAHVRLRRGDLTGAAADASAAFDTYQAYGGGPVPLAHALAALVEAECGQGNYEAAGRALALAPPDPEAGTLGLAGVRFARARLRAAAGAPGVALDEILRIGAEYESLGGGSAALLPWRSDAALLAKRIGRDAQALELAEAELDGSADAGPRALGRALAARAAVGEQADALAVATEAVRQLESVDAPLELGRALVVQGRATAAVASPRAARAIFARALELAERSRARPLAQVARDELVRVGGRPRRGSAVGVEGLTGAELEVARAAASGLSNREIAADLHLAPGTVKNQLAVVFRKLSVGSRSQLRGVLGED